MELNHVNLPVADVSATRDFFEKGSDLEQTNDWKRSKPRLRTELQRPKAMTLKQPASTMVGFDPRFEIIPGTKGNTVLGKGGLIRSG